MPSTTPNLNNDQWLNRRSRNVTAISGEDGILEAIFETIPPENRWCCEFGAWDGKTYSNTFHLMSQPEWHGVFIEADRDKFRELEGTYRNNPLATCVNCFVTFDGDNALDKVLRRAGAPFNIDLLSIDIDGNDYHVWASLNEYKPRVVVIEFNQTIPYHVEFVQPRDMSVQQGSSALSLVKLGRQKGYELVCMTDYNLIFVRSELFAAFSISDNSLHRLHLSNAPQAHIFQLFDGTFVVGGMDQMQWHGIPIRQDKFQILPRIFRRYPPRPNNLLLRVLRRLWLYLYDKGLL